MGKGQDLGEPPDYLINAHKDGQEEEAEREARDYQYEMLKSLREVNVDCNAGTAGLLCPIFQSVINPILKEVCRKYGTEGGREGEGIWGQSSPPFDGW